MFSESLSLSRKGAAQESLIAWQIKLQSIVSRLFWKPWPGPKPESRAWILTLEARCVWRHKSRVLACLASPTHHQSRFKRTWWDGLIFGRIAAMDYPTIEDYVGNTPLVRLQRMSNSSSNTILVKLEGNNPAGSVKDRPALSMISRAEQRGDIKPGDVLIEATSGNTGIALAMAAAIKGYRLILIMPEHMSQERRDAMAAYGAELISVSKAAGMEGARDLALEMQNKGEGRVLDQFANLDNPQAHYETTGPEIWRQSQGKITHFVSSMGTTGTIMGVSRFLKEQNKDIEIIGLQPKEGASIPGIRRWPEAYLPKIFDRSRVDRVIDIDQLDAETTMRRLAREEGIFCGVSSGGAVMGALQVSAEVENAVIVAIICDRGDRYLSTGVFSS